MLACTIHIFLTFVQSETPEDLDASSEQHSVQLSEEEKREKRLEAGIGLVNVMVDCSAELQTSDVDSLSTRVAASGKLPTAEEVRDRKFKVKCM